MADLQDPPGSCTGLRYPRLGLPHDQVRTFRIESLNPAENRQGASCALIAIIALFILNGSQGLEHDMNKWPHWFMFAFVLIFLFAQIIPARADGVSPITFHALNVYPAQSIADGDGTIVWAGSFTNSSCEGIGCNNDPTEIDGGSISLHNQCDGVNCSAQDIYYKVVINLTWDSENSESPSLIFVKNQAKQKLTNPCETGSHSVHYEGTCTLNEQGMISASNISTSSDPNEVHELFAFRLDNNGALRILSVTYSQEIGRAHV